MLHHVDLHLDSISLDLRWALLLGSNRVAHGALHLRSVRVEDWSVRLRYLLNSRSELIFVTVLSEQ